MSYVYCKKFNLLILNQISLLDNMKFSENLTLISTRLLNFIIKSSLNSIKLYLCRLKIKILATTNFIARHTKGIILLWIPIATLVYFWPIRGIHACFFLLPIIINCECSIYCNKILIIWLKSRIRQRITSNQFIFIYNIPA